LPKTTEKKAIHQSDKSRRKTALPFFIKKKKLNKFLSMKTSIMDSLQPKSWSSKGKHNTQA